MIQNAVFCCIFGGDPHLSLMLFTYQRDAEDGEVIVMTTRRDTQKLKNILDNPKARWDPILENPHHNMAT